MHGACPNDSLASRAGPGATLPAMRRALLIVGKPPEPGLDQDAARAAALSRGRRRAVPRLPARQRRLWAWTWAGSGSPSSTRGAAGQRSRPCCRTTSACWNSAARALADALPQAFATHLAEGFDRVVLIGSDNPTLPVGLDRAGMRRSGYPRCEHWPERRRGLLPDRHARTRTSACSKALTGARRASTARPWLGPRDSACECDACRSGTTWTSRPISSASSASSARLHERGAEYPRRP